MTRSRAVASIVREAPGKGIVRAVPIDTSANGPSGKHPGGRSPGRASTG
ncbi:hypothetical protein [Allokutzneria albata]|nr:hypothetical protein [Allokutzneria albata]